MVRSIARCSHGDTSVLARACLARARHGGTASCPAAFARPLAGAHSWADTGTGFLIGSASGLLVSYLHIRTVSPTSPAVSVSASPVQISLGGAF